MLELYFDHCITTQIDKCNQNIVPALSLTWSHRAIYNVTLVNGSDLAFAIRGSLVPQGRSQLF